MYRLKVQAQALMEMPTEDGITTAGPTFEYVPSARAIVRWIMAAPMPVEESVSWGTPRARWVLLATVLGSGIAFLDATVVNVALPTIGTELDASVAGLQWVINGYTLTLASLILIGGSLGDRFGRRQDFPARNRVVRGRVAALRRRAHVRGTRRGPRAPGHRRRVAHARQPRDPSGLVRNE